MTKGKKPLPPDDPRHGTLNGHSWYACRCDDCRQAVNEYNRTNRRKYRAKYKKVTWTGDEPWHGTPGGYSNHRCRCDTCSAAQAEYKHALYYNRQKATA